MGPGDKFDKLLVEKLSTDGSNRSLWWAIFHSYFKCKKILKHIEGTANRPPDPLMFTKSHILIDDAQVDKAEERLQKYLGREGQVKTQIIVPVLESLALMLQQKKTAEEAWDFLVAEMTKKPKMAVTLSLGQL